MELKVYEGYKQTNDNTVPVKDTVQSLTSFNQAFKTPGAQNVTKTTNSKPRIAMFIDVDNVGISRENLMEIIFFANGKYQVHQCHLYGFNDETLPGIREIAAEYNVTTVGKMKFKQPGINCLDSRLLIDAYECAINNRQKIDMIFLWCYPCDLTELFEKIRGLGINTATIDNSIFDCKNKFVSQTFKLYSPYNFNLEQSTYGKIRNQPAEIAPSENIEKTAPVISSASVNNSAENLSEQVNNEVPTEKPEIKTESVNNPHTENTQPEETKSEVSNQDHKTVSESNDKPKEQPGMFDEGFVPPVLPRRTLVERSNPNAPKKPVEPAAEQKQEGSEDSNESNTAGSLVEEIARKLNLALPTEEERAEEEKEIAKQEDEKSGFIMDLLKKAGFSGGDENALKYEDTIGDL